MSLVRLADFYPPSFPDHFIHTHLPWIFPTDPEHFLYPFSFPLSINSLSPRKTYLHNISSDPHLIEFFAENKSQSYFYPIFQAGSFSYNRINWGQYRVYILYWVKFLQNIQDYCLKLSLNSLLNSFPLPRGFSAYKSDFPLQYLCQERQRKAVTHSNCLQSR